MVGCISWISACTRVHNVCVCDLDVQGMYDCVIQFCCLIQLDTLYTYYAPERSCLSFSGHAQVLLPNAPSPLVQRLAKEIESHTFTAPPWAALGGNVVTVLGGMMLAMRKMPDVEATRTSVSLKDGGTVGLDWVCA